MHNDTKAHKIYQGFWVALNFLKGTIVMTWLRGGSQDEDKVYIEAHNTVLEGLSDADMVNRIDVLNGRNIRDQISIEEALEMHEERNLRGFSRRN